MSICRIYNDVDGRGLDDEGDADEMVRHGAAYDDHVASCDRETHFRDGVYVSV